MYNFWHLGNVAFFSLIVSFILIAFYNTFSSLFSLELSIAFLLLSTFYWLVTTSHFLLSISYSSQIEEIIFYPINSYVVIKAVYVFFDYADTLSIFTLCFDSCTLSNFLILDLWFLLFHLVFNLDFSRPVCLTYVLGLYFLSLFMLNIFFYCVMTHVITAKNCDVSLTFFLL